MYNTRKAGTTKILKDNKLKENKIKEIITISESLAWKSYFDDKVNDCLKEGYRINKIEIANKIDHDKVCEIFLIAILEK